MFCVYELVNSLDNEVFYIGKGKKYRPDMHVPAALRGNDYHVHRKIRKILAQGGEIIIHKVLETTDELKALNKEICLIKEYGQENLTNMTDGGEGSSGFRHSVDSIEKIRQSQLGKKLSAESIAKRSVTRKEREIPAWNKGLKMSEEFGRKVGLGGLGRVPWNKGKKMSQSFGEAISRGQLAKSIPILCVETGQIFKNSFEAAKQVGVSGAAIRQAVGRNGTSKGLHWVVLEKDEHFKNPQLKIFGDNE